MTLHWLLHSLPPVGAVLSNECYFFRHHIHKSLARCTKSLDTVPPRLLTYTTTVVLSGLRRACILLLSFINVFTAGVAASISRQFMCILVSTTCSNQGPPVLTPWQVELHPFLEVVKSIIMSIFFLRRDFPFQEIILVFSRSRWCQRHHSLVVLEIAVQHVWQHCRRRGWWYHLCCCIHLSYQRWQFSAWDFRLFACCCHLAALGPSKYGFTPYWSVLCEQICLGLLGLSSFFGTRNSVE